MINLIGVSGKISTGKDTVGKMIQHLTSLNLQILLKILFVFLQDVLVHSLKIGLSKNLNFQMNGFVMVTLMALLKNISVMVLWANLS